MPAGVRDGAGSGQSLIHVHAEPIVTVCGTTVLWTLRLYDEPDGYAQRLPYAAVCTVSIMQRYATISALHGRFDRAAWRAIEAWLRAQGVESAEMERRGRTVILFATDCVDREEGSVRASYSAVDGAVAPESKIF